MPTGSGVRASSWRSRSAQRFLYNMARAMAGTVVYAAEGKFPPEAVGETCRRRPDGGGAYGAAGSLYLTHLWYDDAVERFQVQADMDILP